MPETVAELYKEASSIMLVRGGVASSELLHLLQDIFFTAQLTGERVISDHMLEEVPCEAPTHDT